MSFNAASASPFPYFYFDSYAVVDKSRKQAGNTNAQGRMDDFDIPMQEFSSYRMASDVY